MLDVKQNRLDYGRLLVPPEGFQLSQAVATTYSVDLDTLLSIPVALYYAQTLEGELLGKDVQIIHAIHETAKRLKVYHQKGQLHVPQVAKDIYAYLENSLIPILPQNEFTSFHPKTWVLRYQHTEDVNHIVFRLLVLSRNLTFDRSWDVAACLDGPLTDTSHANTQPLVDFHRWLHGVHPFPNGESFLAELQRVAFELPEGFDQFALHPIGIPGYTANPVARKRATDLLCLSPFLHPKALETIRQNVTSTAELLSRRIELERLPPKLLQQFSSYWLTDMVVDGERLNSSEEGATEPVEQNLHAKVFLFDEADHTTWFLGSSNATQAAFTRNTEFLIELLGTAPATRRERIRKQLLENPDIGELFIPFQPEQGGQTTEEDESQKQAIRTLEFKLLAAEAAAHVSLAENQTNYDLQLKIDLREIHVDEAMGVSVRPFVRGLADQPLQLGEFNTLLFPNISETSLSQFFQFTISEGDLVLRAFLTRIKVAGLPDSRLDNIFKSIINSRDKFFAYLRFLLADDLSKDDLELDLGSEGKTDTGNGGEWQFDMPIFEQLLITASRNPKRLLEVDRIITRLYEENEDCVIPGDFLSMWEVFKAAVPAEEDGND
ncbi:hypothetical protein DTL21_07855 [Bremerella cremea]|uniref:PLD phosphodiesterase domain-containing protein n=1 Tax=Blastopirellula marina TaxID=124 RepID=A0A2S8G088_9BACT|nr:MULTISPECIES: phospholipase D family protein [Pirellulaceae]PQO37846.1 hypothetical protein C5Y83_07850 [Blastopirellula marina]RCS50234.1 hypothetical protein DTL21_07855 [Bremerella cremea]